jgi:hypothetical protein
MKSIWSLVAVLCTSAVVGCGSGLKEFPCEVVTGVVMCEGQPVREAQVYFTPKVTGKSAEAGKPGFAWTGEDGRFELSTYGDGDGAIIGQHIVRVTTGSKYPCNCVGEETRDLMEVEVKADEENEFQIALPKRTSPAPAQTNPFDDPEEDEKN